MNTTEKTMFAVALQTYRKTLQKHNKENQQKITLWNRIRQFFRCQK